MPQPLAPALPPLPPDSGLVDSIAGELGMPPEWVRATLTGERPLRGERRLAVLGALWAPLGGL